jgi:tartrate dehydratase alpha subunit/fumarate hydratase class I-like protein
VPGALEKATTPKKSRRGESGTPGSTLISDPSACINEALQKLCQDTGTAASAVDMGKYNEFYAKYRADRILDPAITQFARSSIIGGFERCIRK